MKVLLILLIFTFVQLNLAQLDFSSLLSEAKNDVSESQKKIQEKVEEREKNLPKLHTGIGGLAAALISSTKNATSAVTSGIRNTASGLTRGVISTAANTGVSFLLSQFRLILNTIGIGKKLTLPTVETSAYGFEVKASGGYFNSLASLEMFGPIEVTIADAETVILDVPLRFNEMKIGYEHLSVSGYFISTSGSFSVEIAKNGVIIQLKLGMDSTCALSVEKVQLHELDGINVEIKGLAGYASMLTEKLTNFIISWIKGNIAGYIQDAVDTNLKAALGKDSKICTNFMPTA